MSKRSFLTSFVQGDVNGQAGFLPASIPSAILADGPVIVPLWAVSMMSLSESYHLPPLTSAASRQLVDTHDDTITLTGALIGWDRFIFKELLEIQAEQSMRGSFLEKATFGKAGGLILITTMTIRTDIYVRSLTFTANASRRDVIDVSLTLAHLPRPGPLAQILDLAAVGVGTLMDFTV